VRMELKIARIRKEMTVQQVADAAGISKSYYSMIENGHRKPSGKVAPRIAAVLGVDIDQIDLTA
jgi:transcriptional regulator with XRE-family HTH domain